jgi:hypothetical protein
VNSFGRIEPILNGQIRQGFQNLIDQESLNSVVSPDKLEIVSVRDFYLNTAESVLLAGDIVRSPFAVSVRYQEKGTVNGVFVQGTLNVQGILELEFQGGVLRDVRVVSFDDSQGLERFGRQLGFISHYDGRFVMSIVPPVVRFGLSKPEVQSEVVGLLNTQMRQR